MWCQGQRAGGAGEGSGAKRRGQGARGEDELEGLTVADLKRQQAANNLKTTGDEDMESEEEDEGDTSPVEKKREQRR